MLEFWKKVNLLLAQKNMNQSQLARMLNVRPNKIHQWIKFDNMPNAEFAYEIAKLLNVKIEYLINRPVLDSSSTYKRQLINKIVEVLKPEANDDGRLIGVQDNWREYESKFSFPSYEIAENENVPVDSKGHTMYHIAESEVLGFGVDATTHGVIKVRGNSMQNAGILSGQFVLIRRHNTPISNQIMAVFISELETCTLRRIKQVDDAWFLVAESAGMKEVKLAPEDKIIGVFVKILAKVFES